MSYFKNLFQPWRLTLSSKSFTDLLFVFETLILLEIILFMVWGRGPPFPHVDKSILPTPFIKYLSVPLLICSTCAHKSDHLCVVLFLDWGHSSHPFVCSRFHYSIPNSIKAFIITITYLKPWYLVGQGSFLFSIYFESICKILKNCWDLQ